MRRRSLRAEVIHGRCATRLELTLSREEKSLASFAEASATPFAELEESIVRQEQRELRRFLNMEPRRGTEMHRAAQKTDHVRQLAEAAALRAQAEVRAEERDEARAHGRPRTRATAQQHAECRRWMSGARGRADLRSARRSPRAAGALPAGAGLVEQEIERAERRKLAA